MDTEKEFIAALLEKEKELEKQLEALRTTIRIFHNEKIVLPSGQIVKKDPIIITIPKTWEEADTWNDKVWFILSKIGSGSVQDIVDELLKYSDKFEKHVLFKKITGHASLMKTKDLIGAKLVGNKSFYHLK